MKIFNIALLLLLSPAGFAQQLETIYLNELVSTHFITSEPIQYVDISTDHIVGDLPVENILRLKPKKAITTTEQGILTIVCQKYMVQYRLLSSDIRQATKSKFISGMDGHGLLLPEITISAAEMKTLSLKLRDSRHAKGIKKSKHQGIMLAINQVCTYGDYYFIDVTIQNRSSIPYEINQLRFHILDKKILKATNVQRQEIEPAFVLYHQNRIRRQYHNVLVFQKFTFPNDKLFELEVSEKQISGRTLRLQLDYADILHAEPL